jgi:hypothetical protein
MLYYITVSVDGHTLCWVGGGRMELEIEERMGLLTKAIDSLKVKRN